MMRSSLGGAGRPALMLLLGCVVPAIALGFNETEQYALGNGPLYHSSSEIFRQLDLLGRLTPLRLQDPRGDNYQRAFRVAPSVTRSRARELQHMPTAFIICNQHAREMITAEVCFWLVRLLARDTKTLMEWPEFRQALAAGAGARRMRASRRTEELESWVAEVVRKVKVEVVPVVNQEGRDYIQRTGDFNQRKTVTTAVDLNRNWVTNRAQPGSGANELNPNSEEWQGPSALSEWQTRSIYDYMKNNITSKALFVDVHSGIWSMMTPWGGKFDTRDIPLATIDRWQALLDAMQPVFQSWPGYDAKGVASAPGSGMLYRSQGSSDDTAFVAAGFPNVLTVEVFSPPRFPDSGVGWECPSLRDWRAACTESNFCSSTVCRDRYGSPYTPSPGRRAERLAAYMQAQAAQPSTAAAAERQQSGAVAAAVAADPFMSLLTPGNRAAGTFRFFNPETAADYRLVVARWCAALLYGLDAVAAGLD